MSESRNDAIDDALARAVVYHLLTIGFQFPTAARLDRIGAREGFPVVTAALDRIARRRGVGGVALARCSVQLAALAEPAIENLEAAYWRLFGHTTSGPICACETEWGPDNGFQQPQQLANISGYYLAFGLRFGTAPEIRADHIACECEFMDFLNRKEVRLLGAPPADAAGDDTLDVTRQAARTFLRDHLGRFGRAFGARVAAADDGYFGGLGQLLLAFLDADCARVGVRGGPVDLQIRPPAEDTTPMACGSADDLIQIQRRP